MGAMKKEVVPHQSCSHRATSPSPRSEGERPANVKQKPTTTTTKTSMKVYTSCIISSSVMISTPNLAETARNCDRRKTTKMMLTETIHA